MANLHVTVAFVGDVARSRIVELCAIGAAVASNVPAFDLTLDRTGAYRGTGIAWAGPSHVPGALSQLARGLAEALAAGGFPVERRDFSPHVTLARRSGRFPPAAIATPIRWTATRVALYASEAVAGGQRYRELGGWLLVGPGPAETAS